MSEKTIFFIDANESVFQSIGRDVVTFGFMLLCIYVSRGSTFWTFVSGSIFIAFIGAKLIKNDRAIKFKNIAELKEYLEGMK